MVQVDTVLIKVASRCNINCAYCYVFNMGDSGWSRMPKRMSPKTCQATAVALAQLARDQGRPFSVVLHGGEPLLLGFPALCHLVETLRGAIPAECSISIQTNGMLITPEVLDLCAEARVTLAVSLDGPQHVHDRNRVGFGGGGTFNGVMAGLRLIQDHPDADDVFTGLLAVVDPASDPGEVYAFFKGLRPPSVDFIYRDGNHSELPEGKASAASTEYGRWMVDLLTVYLADKDPIPIRILDDIIKLVLGGVGTKEGTGPTSYGVLIVDTDGSVTKNDTLKSAFDGADQFCTPWSVHTHRLSEILRTAEFADYHAMQRPTSPTCLSCPLLGVCGGGMPLHRWEDGVGFDNPSVYCDDQRLLIGHIQELVASAEAVA